MAQLSDRAIPKVVERVTASRTFFEDVIAAAGSYNSQVWEAKWWFPVYEHHVVWVLKLEGGKPVASSLLCQCDFGYGPFQLHDAMGRECRYKTAARRLRADELHDDSLLDGDSVRHRIERFISRALTGEFMGQADDGCITLDEVARATVAPVRAIRPAAVALAGERFVGGKIILGRTTAAPS